MKISTDHDYVNNFIGTDEPFSFGPVIYDDVLKKVNTLDTAKASQQSDIPTKILKQNSDYFAEYFYKNMNQCISNSVLIRSEIS